MTRIDSSAKAQALAAGDAWLDSLTDAKPLKPSSWLVDPVMEPSAIIAIVFQDGSEAI